jgi:glycosyltransferase involved in cell wall biosynthesis
MMNIWLVNHYANAPHEAGDARHFSHARELMQRGHQTRVITCNFDHLKHKHLPMTPGATWENTTIQGVPFTWITACPYQKNLEMRRIWNMMEFAQRVWKGEWTDGLAAPDLVLGSTPDPFAAFAAERLAARYGVPFILEVRDLWPYVFTEIGGISRFHPFVILVDKLMRYLYSRAARIVLFSGGSTQLMARYGAPLEKLVWIPHGVDLNLNPQPRPAPDDGIFTITYLGAHNKWNSLDAVLDAAKILKQDGVKNVLLRFVGDGESKAALVERVRAEGIDNARFDDPVPKTQVPAIKHESDAFIINNRNDKVSSGWMSFNKIYDYLAAGRPVVFGSCTQDDPVREAGAGISVNADDPKALAKAIALLAGQTPEQLHAYGVRGRTFIEKNYSISSLVSKFETTAETCIAEANSRTETIPSLAGRRLDR